ncbi:hypothetical protein [uncultured Maribacter sp.]|uniref:hypothetical protein n=1 Tax=uncultured Maribacter sp. TaxID=431308 RepID=UPI0030EB5DF6|tara:strand:- start:90847 stop:91302 length:456 start_codon:yes stop_codon:yes gene_type:complete
MSIIRNRPKGSYIHEADWQQLFILTEHWKSDLEFFKEDLEFLNHIISKYFIWISKKDNIDLVREIEVGLLELNKKCDAILKQVNKHLHHLAELIDNPFAYDSHTFRTEHEQLEDDIAMFVKDFRKNRKEVFTITEHVIDGEEMIKKLGLVI